MKEYSIININYDDPESMKKVYQYLKETRVMFIPVKCKGRVPVAIIQKPYKYSGNCITFIVKEIEKHSSWDALCGEVIYDRIEEAQRLLRCTTNEPLQHAVENAKETIEDIFKRDGGLQGSAVELHKVILSLVKAAEVIMQMRQL